MVNICNPEPTADTSNYNFHPRATALHRLNLQVLPGWNKSKEGDEEITFSIVLVTLVSLSPDRMSPPLLHRQTQNTWRLLQLSVLCLFNLQARLYLLVFDLIFHVFLWRAPCDQFHRGCCALKQSLQPGEWVNSSPFKHNPEGHNFSTYEMVFQPCKLFFFCSCSFMSDFKTVFPTIKSYQCLISSSIFLDAAAKITWLIQLAKYYWEGVFMVVPARTTKLAVASRQPEEEIKRGSEIIWNKM